MPKYNREESRKEKQRRIAEEEIETMEREMDIEEVQAHKLRAIERDTERWNTPRLTGEWVIYSEPVKVAIRRSENIEEVKFNRRYRTVKISTMAYCFGLNPRFKVIASNFTYYPIGERISHN